MKLMFEPQPPVIVPTTTGEAYPVRRIFCVGRNYAEHTKEMGFDPQRDPPFFFTKFAEAIVGEKATIAYPSGTKNFHHEIELVVAIGKGGRNIKAADAEKHIWGYAVGLDMTRRDLQLEARDKGRPWDTGKNVEQSAPLGLLHPKAEMGGLAQKGRIHLTVNGQTRQDADLADLIWPVADVVEFLSKLWELHPGDLIYTGTPAGVGAVVPGDVMHAEIAGLSPITIMVGPAAA